jgi:excisionase family DNA binding protein
MSETQLLTLMEVATTLRISPHTVRAFVRQGRLRPVRICRRLLFSAADIEQLIARSIDDMTESYPVRFAEEPVAELIRRGTVSLESK